MRLPKAHSVAELMRLLEAAGHPASAEGPNGTDPGDPAAVHVHGINVIHKVEAGDLSYADHPKYAARTLASAATCVLLPTGMDIPRSDTEDRGGKLILRVDDPFTAFNALLAHFSPEAPMDRRVHPTATIGNGCRIEEGAVIGAEVVLGEGCTIHAGAVLYPRTVLGKNVRIHAGAVLGGHAYFYRTRSTPGHDGAPEQRHYQKMRTAGRVVVGDGVEIGANSTVDAGATGDTVIGRGSKLDNLVHIGHGAVIGEHCLLAAQVGVGGKTIIGDRCIFWGQVGISKDLTIGDDTIVYAQSGIKDSLPAGKVWFGSPVREARDKMKELAATKDLYAMWRDWGRGDG